MIGIIRHSKSEFGEIRHEFGCETATMSSSTGAKLSFSLKAKPKAANVAPPPKTTPAAFGALEDDVQESVPLAMNSKKPVAQHTTTSRALKKKMEEEKMVDQTVFEYDEVWDRMKDAEKKAKAAKEANKETGVRTLLLAV